MEILLARVDDRLLHGQVTMQWIPHTGADTVIIVDDDISGSEFMKNLIISAAPERIEVYIFNSHQAVEFLKDNSGHNKIILLSRKIYNYEKMIEKGIHFREINIGCSGNISGSEKICTNIYMTKKEIESAAKIISAGTDVLIQTLPENKIINMRYLIEDII